jgi:hypothetical protein
VDQLLPAEQSTNNLGAPHIEVNRYADLGTVSAATHSSDGIPLAIV